MATIITKVDMEDITEEITLLNNSSNPRMGGIMIRGTTPTTVVVDTDRTTMARHRRMPVLVGKEWVCIPSSSFLFDNEFRFQVVC